MTRMFCPVTLASAELTFIPVVIKQQLKLLLLLVVLTTVRTDTANRKGHRLYKDICALNGASKNDFTAWF